MNKINRSLVKTQAKQIIKNKVFYLFLISFIVAILTSSGYSYNLNVNLRGLNNPDYYGDLFDDYSHHSDDYFDDFDFDNYDNPIEGFEFDSNTENADTNITNLSADNAKTASVFSAPLFAGTGSVLSLVGLILAPLSVTLAGIYVALIKRNANQNFDFGKEFSGLFKNTFNENYLKKLVGAVLVNVITVLLMLLFIVPGVIFSYSAYFTFQLMNDYPNLKPSEAIKLSKKIIRGNRSELFVYDLSFIPWYLLTVVTCGLASIYVIPYKSTCDALYYENFRLRALAEGRITEDDFLSEQERLMKYNNVNSDNPYQNGGYYTQGNANQGAQYQPYQQQTAQQYNPQYSAPQPQYTANYSGTFFTPDFTPVDPYNPYANQNQPQQGSAEYYYNQQNHAQPQNPYYAQPEQPRPQESANQTQQSNDFGFNASQPQENASAPSYYNPPQDAESFGETDNTTGE